MDILRRYILLQRFEQWTTQKRASQPIEQKIRELVAMQKMTAPISAARGQKAYIWRISDDGDEPVHYTPRSKERTGWVAVKSEKTK